MRNHPGLKFAVKGEVFQPLETLDRLPLAEFAQFEQLTGERLSAALPAIRSADFRARTWVISHRLL